MLALLVLAIRLWAVAFADEEEERVVDKTRLFPEYIKLLCWEKSPKILNRHPDRWRYDAVGNPVMKQLRNCYGIACYQFDHIKPYSLGGSSLDVSNCQILQSRVNMCLSQKK